MGREGCRCGDIMLEHWRYKEERGMQMGRYRGREGCIWGERGVEKGVDIEVEKGVDGEREGQ